MYSRAVHLPTFFFVIGAPEFYKRVYGNF